MKVVEKVCAGFWYHVFKIKTTMQTALDLQMKFVLSRSTPTIVGGARGRGGALLTQGVNNNDERESQ